MFIQIDIERVRDRLTIKQLSEKSGIKYDTLLSKLNGHSEFTRSEMLKIQKAFTRHIALEILFSENAEAG